MPPRPAPLLREIRARRRAAAAIGPSGDDGAAGALDGRLDGFIDGSVLGWVWCPARPERRVEVLVTVDDRQVATARADRPRSSLREARIGDGAHAFAVVLPASVDDGATHTIRALAGAGRQPLPAALGFSVSAAPGGPFADTELVPVDRQGMEPPLGAGAPPSDASGGATAAARRRAGAWLAARRAAPESIPVWLLSAGCAFYFLLFLYLSRDFSFFQDEYKFILVRRAWDANAFLTAHNQALSLVPVIVYKLLFVTVGLGTTWPYRVPVFALHIVCVWGLFVLARRRSDPWLALIPACLLLVLGAGFEDELWAFQTGFLGSVAGGLWALHLLDRHDRRGDVWASVLVAVSLASSNVGIPFTVAIACELLLRRRRELWVVGVPLVLYVLWYEGYGQSDILWSNVSATAGYDLHIAAYGFAGIVGLSSYTDGAGGAVLAVGELMLAASVVSLIRVAVREWPLPERTVAGIAGALAFWTATALARAQLGQPDASRYVYPSAVFILLTAIAVMRPLHVTRRAWIAIAAAGVVVAIVGYGPLHTYAIERTSVDARVRVAFGAAQLAGSAGDPAFYPDHHHLPFVTLGPYMQAVRALGSPAFDTAQIEREPSDYRQLADATLIGAERVTPRPFTALTVGAPCTGVRAAGEYLGVTAAPGDAVFIVAGAFPVSVWLRRLDGNFRFAPQWTVDRGSGSELSLPRDASSIPWHVQVLAASAVGRAASGRDASGLLASVCVAPADRASVPAA